MCLQEELDSFLHTLKVGDVVVFKTEAGIPCIGKFVAVESSKKSENKHEIRLGWNGGGINVPVSIIAESTLRKAMETEIIFWKLQDEDKAVGTFRYDYIIGG